LHALHEAGLRVPEDVSVLGFDDIPEASHFFPALTTVRLDFDAVGRACVTMLINTIQGRASNDVVLPPPELIARASAAPPRRA
jgi:DNA-binding LacI/PurR family transcriptional regulator